MGKADIAIGARIRKSLPVWRSSATHKRKAHTVHLRTSEGEHRLSLHMHIEDRNIYVGRKAVVIMDIPYYHLCSTTRGGHLAIGPLVRAAVLSFVSVRKPQIVRVVGFLSRMAKESSERELILRMFSSSCISQGAK